MTNIPRRPAAKGVIYPEELRDQLNRILASQEEQLKNQQRLEIQVTQLQASVPTRTEIQVLLDQRVPQSVYRIEMDAMKTDITELKGDATAIKKRMDDQPGTTFNRVIIIVSIVISLGALIVAVITLLR